MIKVEPYDIEGAYQKLLAPKRDKESLDAFIDSIEMLNGKEEIKKIIKGISTPIHHYESKWILTPEPIKHINLVIHTDGVSYSGEVNLESSAELRQPQQQIINKNLTENNNKRIDMGNGVLFNFDGEPFFTLMYVDYLRLARLFFGSNGTAQRKLSGLPHFEQDFKNICEITQEVLNAMYKAFGKEETPDYKIKLFLSNGYKTHNGLNISFGSR